MNAAFCNHNETTIQPPEDGVREEVCHECSATVDTHRDEFVCGSTDTADGSECQRLVSSRDETCFDH